MIKPPDRRRLDGRVALISGGARGQGAHDAEVFVEHGAKVVIGDVRVEECAAVASSINERWPRTAEAVELDVTSRDDWDRAVQRARSSFSGLHVLINNAGIATAPTPLMELEFSDWDRTIQVNLTGCLLGMQAAVPVMLETMDLEGDKARSASIVNVSSVQAMRPTPRSAAYTASKWGQRGLSRSAALDLAPRIRINTIFPGPIDTPMLQDGSDDPAGLVAKLIGSIPLQRVGTTYDIASVLVFLASDESAFCTGAELTIDGGRAIA